MSTAAPRRSQSPRGEGERLREEIVEAATALLLETGDHEAVSIRAIAGRVGVTPPAIYLHFADKDALLFEVCARQFERFAARLWKAAQGGGDLVTILTRMARAYVRFGVEHPTEYRLLFMGGLPERPEGTVLEDLPAWQAFTLLTRLLDGWMESGDLRPGDPLGVAVVVWEALHGLTALEITARTWPPELAVPPLDRRVDLLCGALLDGLRARE